jgi:hypothetical protein
MFEVLKSYPAYEVSRPGAAMGLARAALRSWLLVAAKRAAELAARLENAERAQCDEVCAQAALRAYWSNGSVGKRLAEGVVSVAAVAYFVAGLVAIFLS